MSASQHQRWWGQQPGAALSPCVRADSRWVAAAQPQNTQSAAPPGSTPWYDSSLQGGRGTRWRRASVGNY